MAVWCVLILSVRNSNTKIVSLLNIFSKVHRNSQEFIWFHSRRINIYSISLSLYFYPEFYTTEGLKKNILQYLYLWIYFYSFMLRQCWEMFWHMEVSQARISLHGCFIIYLVVLQEFQFTQLMQKLHEHLAVLRVVWIKHWLRSTNLP